MANHVTGAASFSKNFTVLQAIADAENSPTVAELLNILDIPRPTLYRFLYALEVEGLIEQGHHKRWRLGPRLIQLASKVWQDSDLRKIARPYLELLRDQTGETVHLAVRNGREMMYIDKVESHEAIRMTSTIGAKVPFHSSSVGKAYLLEMDQEERDAILSIIEYPAITKNSTKSRSELESQLEDFIKLGYALESEENELLVACFGSAIKDKNDILVGAISISVPIFRIKDEHDFYTSKLVNVSKEIATLLPPF